MTCRIRAFGLAALFSAASGVTGCGSSAPGPVAPPPPPAPLNVPPVVRAVELEQVRVEAGSSIKVTALVEDAETPLDQLRYEWTASAGTFAGEGREVSWHAPAEVDEPFDVTLSVAVVETVSGNAGQVNRTTFAAPDTVRVHDSVAELASLARTFLDDFIDNSVSPADAVRNFSDGCPGKQSELQDVQRVRTLFTMLGSSSYSIRSVTIVEPWVRGGIIARCEFRSREKATGAEGTARGTCTLTAVYESNRWMLCDSHFNGPMSSLSSVIR